MPISWIYLAVISLRRFFYQKNIFKTKKFPVPVIIVGNITVGGTGKTPLVIWLAKLLKRNGYHPGIVSRGYGGKANFYPREVTANSNAAEVGDEAVLLAQKTNCPVVVDPNRCKAVTTLLEKNNCDIVISDDGLQHYALARDIEIAVIDGQRRLGNGFCLPAGPLREPKKRLHEVDFIVVNNGETKEGEYATHLLLQSIYNLVDTDAVLDLKNLQTPVHAVAAIGNPNNFFNSLMQLGLMIIPHAFPDHYLFKQEDFNFLDDSIVVMTEKDAVKCKDFADHRFWCLPIEIEAPELAKAILKKLNHLSGTKAENGGLKISD